MAICSFISPFVLCFPCCFSVSNFYITSQYHQFPLSHPAAAATVAAVTAAAAFSSHTLSSSSSHSSSSSSSLHPSHHSPPSIQYIHCFSELRRIILEQFFDRDYASRDQIYHFIHLALRNTTVRTRTPLEYYTATSNISEKNKLLCNY